MFHLKCKMFKRKKPFNVTINLFYPPVFDFSEQYSLGVCVSVSAKVT